MTLTLRQALSAVLAAAYAGLAAMYVSHPDFQKRYETPAGGFTDYLTTAMRAYPTRQQESH